MKSENCLGILNHVPLSTLTTPGLQDLSFMSRTEAERISINCNSPSFPDAFLNLHDISSIFEAEQLRKPPTLAHQPGPGPTFGAASDCSRCAASKDDCHDGSDPIFRGIVSQFKAHLKRRLGIILGGPHLDIIS